MAWSLSSRLPFSRFDLLPPSSPFASPRFSSSLYADNSGVLSAHQNSFLRSLLIASGKPFAPPPSLAPSESGRHICRAAEYRFPDPIPEFADAVSFDLCVQISVFSIPVSSFLWVCFVWCAQEAEKFRTHLVKKLSKKDMFGDSIQDVVGICTEVEALLLVQNYLSKIWLCLQNLLHVSCMMIPVDVSRIFRKFLPSWIFVIYQRIGKPRQRDITKMN